MISEIHWSAEQENLFSALGRFDRWSLSWDGGEIMPGDCVPIDPAKALRRLAETGPLRRVPVGIIGPKEATQRQYELAGEMGAALAWHGLQLLCGGKNGVMEAACKGCLEAGGLPVGLLPDEEWRFANPYVAIPIATGIGPARNAIIARASQAMVAIGGGYGTLSEMAYGLHFDKPVFTLDEAPFVEGAIACDGVEDAVRRIAGHILGAPRRP